MNKRFLIVLAAFFPIAALSAGAVESDLDSTSWADGKYATGNGGGTRDHLAARGLEPFLYYTNIMSGNPVGGMEQGFTYVDDFYFGVKLDLEKLADWRGAKFVISGVNRDGRGLTEHYVGSRYDVQQTVGGQNIFLYQVFLEQKLFGEKVSLKVGRFGASDDFNGSPIYSYYLNNGIDGDIRNVLFDTQFSAYPFATWAARLRIDPSPEFNAQLGVFQTWDDIFDRTHNGLNWGIRSDDGVFLIAQAGWTPEFFKRPVPGDTANKSAALPVMRGLPGHYWVGGSFSPWNHFSQFGSAEKTSGSYGFYVHGDQMVYQEKPGSDQGLTLWVASGLYPQENISIVPFQVNVGAIYQGLIPTRDNDRLIFGVIYGRFSRDYARTVMVAGNGSPNHEMVVEAAYRIQLTKFAWIEPDVQWVINPAGAGQIPDALVLGAEMGLVF